MKSNIDRRTLPSAATLLAALCATLACAPASADLAGGQHEYAAGHYKEALAQLQAPAMGGDAAAQTLMGKIYLENYGAPRFENARFWLQKAVTGGNEDARYYLGIVNTLLANANAEMSHRADPGATVDDGGKVTAYRMVRMKLKAPEHFEGPLLSLPYYGRKEGILFGAASQDNSVALFLSALPYDAGTPHATAAEREAAAEKCVAGTSKAYSIRVQHFIAGKRQGLEIAGAPAARLETNGSDHGKPLYGAAYCIAQPDQLYTFQVVQLGTGDHIDAKAAMQAVELATFADN